jgi:hypothetical protein
MATPCITCGFDGSGLSPSDAVVALRSFPRRFAALGSVDDDGDEGSTPNPDAAAAARAGMIREASAAASQVAAAGEAMRRVLIEDRPTLDNLTTASTSPTTPEDAVRQLTDAVEPVAGLASTTSGGAWTRTGTLNGATVTALDLLNDAVHAGAHHLRAAGR